MWDAIALENQNGLLRHYLVSVLELDTGEIDMYTAGATQLNISGLHPHYTYTCMVAAVTIRIGPFSQSVSIITPQDGDLKIIFVDVTDFTRYVYLHLLKDNACFLCCRTVSIIIEEPAFIVSCCLLTIPNMTWLTFSLIGCSPIWFSLEFHNWSYHPSYTLLLMETSSTGATKRSHTRLHCKHCFR